VPICGHTAAPKDHMGDFLFRPSRHEHRRILAGLFAGALAALLAGCSTGADVIGTAMVDPAQFTFYKCPDLIARNRAAMVRQRELRDLMDKAEKETGGALVSAMAYRSEYVSLGGELRLLHQVAAEQNCTLPPPAPIENKAIR
jgi:hypothetical protein